MKEKIPADIALDASYKAEFQRGGALLGFPDAATLVAAPPAEVVARFEILDEDGYRLHGFTKDEAMPMKTDDIAHEAQWKEKKITDLPAGRYLLRVHLEKADLFAVTLK